MPFLPIAKETDDDEFDFICVTGDAYVDHPSFGIAVISRILSEYGYRVGIIAQPNHNTTRDFTALGQPLLGFLVTSGNIDSMVNNYTVAKKTRNKDIYSPGGIAGKRPDRAAIVYSRRLREIYPDTPIILGGLEASLRRLSHYDYWDNKVRRSILLDSSADLIVYGMGEHPIIEIAEALKSGLPVNELTYIRGTVYRTKDKNRPFDYITLPSYKEVTSSRKKYSESFLLQYKNTDSVSATKSLVESYGDTLVVQNPPSAPLTTNEMDRVHNLPYMRDYHPIYQELGGVPAISEVKFSITSSRGCFGSCNFCALTFHQGRRVQARSHDSILTEAEVIIKDPGFKGYIHDVGGPTANFRAPACKKQENHGVCTDKLCLFPKICDSVIVSHKDYLSLLKKIRSLPKVKKVFIRSGLRYDYLIADKNKDFFYELCKHHISGQLKVAPEHVSEAVLEKMGKPGRTLYDKFVAQFEQVNMQLGKNQYLVPYLMSSHPGSRLANAVELAEYLRDKRLTPEQVQDFYPTPGTSSTCMYYTETDPFTGESVYVPKTPHEKAMQRALIQYRLPQNYELVLEALKKAGRMDLVGYDKKCLIRPRNKQNKPKNMERMKPNGNKVQIKSRRKS